MDELPALITLMSDGLWIKASNGLQGRGLAYAAESYKAECLRSGFETMMVPLGP